MVNAAERVIQSLVKQETMTITLTLYHLHKVEMEIFIKIGFMITLLDPNIILVESYFYGAKENTNVNMYFCLWQFKILYNATQYEA